MLILNLRYVERQNICINQHKVINLLLVLTVLVIPNSSMLSLQDKEKLLPDLHQELKLIFSLTQLSVRGPREHPGRTPGWRWEPRAPGRLHGVPGSLLSVYWRPPCILEECPGWGGPDPGGGWRTPWLPPRLLTSPETHSREILLGNILHLAQDNLNIINGNDPVQSSSVQSSDWFYLWGLDTDRSWPVSSWPRYERTENVTQHNTTQFWVLPDKNWDVWHYMVPDIQTDETDSITSHTSQY